VTGGTAASLMAANAVLRGVDPSSAVAKALRRYRLWNWAWYVEAVKIPGLADLLLRTAGAEVAMLWPRALNSWFSRA
jgi:hypothetical protein